MESELALDAPADVGGDVLHEVWDDRAAHLGARRNASKGALSNAIHLLEADVRDDGRCLLLLVDAEATEKSRQPGETSARIAETHDQVPIHRESERLVDTRADFVPDS